MSFPAKYQYTKEHEWIEIVGDLARVGITKFAIEQLGDVVHLDLPKVGAEFKAHDTFGSVESTKTVSDLYSPVAGIVKEVNAALAEAPENLADDPYENGWLIKLSVKEAPVGLLAASEYEKYVSEDGGH